MKIRSGFVSNSSSSSFCIMGMVTDQETVDKLESKWKELNEKGLTTKSGISEYYEEQLIGASVSQLGENETPVQFKQRIVDSFKELDVEIKITNLDWCVDGGRDG